VPYEPDTAIGGRLDRFPSTRRSLIKTAGSSGAIRQEALSSIIAVYWKPAYKYLRIKWRRSNEDAKDLVQGFFTVLIERDVLANFDPAKGRFRTYLQTCLDRFVMKQDEYAKRLKRGGDRPFELNFEEAECELAGLKGELAAYAAEEIFFREWRREIFVSALRNLETSCYETGKELQYRIFEEYDLAEEERPSYAEIAARHRVPVSSVTNYLAWSRRELRRLVDERVNSVTPNHRERSDESRLVWRK
jgi:RNA polymerase sigma factor (sigma-70 family)